MCSAFHVSCYAVHLFIPHAVFICYLPLSFKRYLENMGSSQTLLFLIEVEEYLCTLSCDIRMVRKRIFPVGFYGGINWLFIFSWLEAIRQTNFPQVHPPPSHSPDSNFTRNEVEKLYFKCSILFFFNNRIFVICYQFYALLDQTFHV